MAGGLIQIAQYGSQDLFLTGVPEITFFKSVYRKYTNFSMESVRINFDDPVEFGSTSTIKLPKVGDLIHKTYVEITLPEISLYRPLSYDKIERFRRNVDQAQKDYDIVVDFMKINRESFVEAYYKYITENNINAMEDMIRRINQVFINSDKEVIDRFKELIYENNTATFQEVDLKTIASYYLDSNQEVYNKESLLKALKVGLDKSIKLQKYYFKILQKEKEKLEDAQNRSMKFAWIKKLGHFVMDWIEVSIGGNRIDKHYGDWLNIWSELSGKDSLQKIYDKMIGNVPKLTKFNRDPKPQYTMYIPLQFWFCRFSGCALPLVSLQHQDVSLRIKFKNFEQVAYSESPDILLSPNSRNVLSLEDVPEEFGSNITANLLVDYIYLDIEERKRFAKSSHEYLIEQVQLFQKENITQQQISVHLDSFINPSKELIWTVQQDQFVEPSENKEIQYYNYTFSPEARKNPIVTSTLDVSSHNRIAKFTGNYFNYVQPFETHSRTPSDGVNVYSFSLYPEENQPSGSINLGSVSKVVLRLEFDHTGFVNGITSKTFTLRVYSRSLNILRFVNGYGGLAWV